MRSILTAVAGVALLSACAHAQTAQAGGTITVGSGFSYPSGVAVDGSGDVFVAEPTNHAVMEIVAINGVVSSSSMVNTVGSGFSSPTGVAVDGSGDVFVADNLNSAVKEIVAINGVVSSSSTVITVGSGFSSPYGVAVDGSGDVFVTDPANSAVEEIVAINGVVSSSSTVNTVGSGFSSPAGVAVDGSGDVFVADLGSNAVEEIVAINGVVSSSSAVNTVGSGFSGPTGVAVDGSGNVFVADHGNNAVKEIVAINGVVSSSSTVNTVGSGFSSPFGVSVDGSGDVFVADYLNNAVKEIVAGAEKFPATAVGSTSATIEVYFTFDSGGSLAAMPYLVLTQGKQNGDFQAAATQDGNACVPSYAYSSGDLCTVTVTFTPTRPGQRLGAVQLMGSAGTPIATGFISGKGTGPMVTFSPGAGSTVGSGFNYPYGVAVDGSGNVFVADTFNHAVKEIVAVNGVVSSSSTVNTVGSGFSNPQGVAVDGSGNVFVADWGSGAVMEIVAVNGVVSSSSTVNAVGTYFFAASGVAVDGSGDVFVAGYYEVAEIVAVNGVVSSSSTVNTVSSGFSRPTGVAVDGSGNVFVADYGNNEVAEIVAVNGVVSSSSTVNPVGSGFSSPYGLAVDGSGNVFVADSGNNVVKEIVAVKGFVSSESTVNLVASGFSFPPGVSVDGSGNIFIVDYGNEAVKEIDFAVPPALNFALTAVGATSPDSPQTVTITNDGNATLSFPALSLGGANPTIAVNFPLDSSTTCPQVNSSAPASALSPQLRPMRLAAGNSCIYAINFIPVASGSLSGSLVVTDTNLNATAPTYATQSIPLSGTATTLDATQTAVTASPSPVAVGQPVTLTAAVSDTTTPATVPTGGVSFTDSVGGKLVSLNNGTAVPLSGGIATLPATLTSVGAHTITAHYAGISGSTAASTGSVSLTVAAIAPTLSFAPIKAQTYGNAPFAVSATSASSGTVTYTVASGPATIAGHTVTLTGVGTVMLSASQAASGNYTAATATTGFNVEVGVPVLSFGPIAAQTYGNPPFAVSATSASSGAVTYAVVSGPATIAVNLVTLKGAGTVVLSAIQAASGNYAAATANASVTVAGVATTLSFGPIAAQTYGNAPFAVSATSASSGAVTYTVVSGPATIAGNTVTLTGPGTVVLRASQAASGNYAAATATTSFTVTAAPAGFTLTPSSGSVVQAVLPGGAAAFKLTLAPGSGSTFPDALTFSATGLPAGATVAFSPATIAAGSGATPVTMTIQTINPQTAHSAKPGGSLGSIALALLLLPMAGIKPVRRRLKKLPGLPVVLAAAALSLGALVCLGGCGSSGVGFFNQAPKSYTVVVTATDTVTGAHSSTNVTLNVQ